MRNNSYGDHMRLWEELTTAVESHSELAHLEPARALLDTELEAFKDTNVLQASLRSQTQQASRDIQEHVERGRILATQLRDGIRAVYGRTAERLVEFRMQPRRMRSKTKVPVPPPPENTKPSEQGSTPTRTASPETDASTQE
jgi:hypothetical protein